MALYDKLSNENKAKLLDSYTTNETTYGDLIETLKTTEYYHYLTIGQASSLSLSLQPQKACTILDIYGFFLNLDF